MCADVPFRRYTMIAVFPILFVFWKFFKKTEFRKPEDVDLFQDLPEIEEYHRNFIETPPKYVPCRLLNFRNLVLTRGSPAGTHLRRS